MAGCVGMQVDSLTGFLLVGIVGGAGSGMLIKSSIAALPPRPRPPSSRCYFCLFHVDNAQQPVCLTTDANLSALDTRVRRFASQTFNRDELR